jgi:hypothetical protein
MRQMTPSQNLWQVISEPLLGVFLKQSLYLMGPSLRKPFRRDTHGEFVLPSIYRSIEDISSEVSWASHLSNRARAQSGLAGRCS